jgi:catechol-2,3-dioxygenase
MIRLLRLGHVVLRVADRERSTDFYKKFLGMEVMEDDPKNGATLLSLGDSGNNTIDLLTSRDPAAGSGPHKELRSFDGLGMHHFAFEVESHERLRDAYFTLQDNRVPIIGSIDHESRESIYFNDPDGNIIEFYWDRKVRTKDVLDLDEELTFER